MIYDALAPGKLSVRARKAIDSASAVGELACSDISLWEIAMLASRKRIDLSVDVRQFLEDLIRSREIRVMPITAEIAVLSQSDMFAHGDRADRLIAATALLHRAQLVTSDMQLRKLKKVSTLW